MRYSLSWVSGASQRTPKFRTIVGSCEGPTPRRTRPGASCDTVSACCAMITGWRGHVGTMAVPRRIELVAVAAAAKAVSESAFAAPPMVVHATGTPQSSARWIWATNSRDSSAWIAAPMVPVMRHSLRYERLICPH